MKLASAAAIALGLAVLFAGAPAQSAGDPAAGQKVFNKCKTCHEVDQPKNKVGPQLIGIFGRKAGSLPDFKYSDAMKNSGITWDDKTIAQYVKDPKGFIPGNKMTFAGLKSDQEVEDLIAYLKQATAPK
jgi:cytochrome c